MDLLQLSDRSETQISPASVSKEPVLGDGKNVEPVEIHEVDDSASALKTLLYQEETYYRSQCLQGLDLLFKKDNEKLPIVVHWFSSMTEWCFCVADGYKLPPQTVEVAMNLLDRYILATCQCADSLGRKFISLKPKDDNSFRSVSEFKLVTVTCFHLASKMSSSFMTLTPTMLETVARKEIEAREIETMAMKILSKIEFQVKPPTIVSFAEEMKNELELSWNSDDEETNKLQESIFSLLVETQARHAMTKLMPLHVGTSPIALASVKNALQVMEAQSLLDTDSVDMSSVSFQQAWRGLEKEVQLSNGMSRKELLDVQAMLQFKLRMITRQTAHEWKQKNSYGSDDDSPSAEESIRSPSLRLSVRSVQSLSTIEEHIEKPTL